MHVLNLQKKEQDRNVEFPVGEDNTWAAHDVTYYVSVLGKVNEPVFVFSIVLVCYMKSIMLLIK